MKKRIPNWPQIPDHPNRLLITGAPGSGKTNALLNIMNHQPDTDKIHLYPKGPYEAKYQLLINKRENVGFNDSKEILNNWMIWIIFMKILMNMTSKKWKYWWIAQNVDCMDNMTVDMLSSKTINPIVT